MLFGFALCASLAICCFGLAKTSLASDWMDVTGGINGVELMSLMQASDGSIYAGGAYYSPSTYYARVWQYSSGVWTDVTGNLEGSYVSSLVQSSDGSIYAGGVYNDSVAKVWKYSNGVWTDTTVNGDLDGNVVNALILASDGSIYAGGQYNTYHARVWRYSNGIWTNITGEMNGLNGHDIYTLFQASDSSIYAGGEYTVSGFDSYAGVWKYSGNIWTNTGNVDGNVIYSLAQTNDGSIYAGGNNDISSVFHAKVWKYTNSVWQDTMLTVTGNSGVHSLLALGNTIQAAGEEDVMGGDTVNKIWSYSNNVWSETILGSFASYHTGMRALLLASDGFYAGGYLGPAAKIWMRSYTSEELRQIEENNLINGDNVILIPALDEQTISGQDLEIYFKDLPNKLTKDSAFWMQWQKFDKYPTKWKLKKKTALKRYWSLTTNLNSYKGKAFKIKVTFKYTQNLYKKLHKKNKKIKEKNLKLFTYEKKKWKIIRAKMNKKKNTMSYVFKKFKQKTSLYAIGASN